jgi:adenosylmethionine-8-amino-7-oxononanoate aminotransferase
MKKYPDGQVLYRNLSKEYPLVKKAKGPYIWDTDGKKYFDGSGGALVMSLGHSCEPVLKDYIREIKKVTYVNGMQFSTPVLESFAHELVSFLPDQKASKKSEISNDRKVFLLGSGSEAIEAAIKFARQLWVERGQSERKVFIARSPGYHGNTLFALSASARPYYKKFFGPLLSEVEMVSAPYEYRCPVDYTRDGADYYIKELQACIEKVGPHRVAGFIAETVGGSSTGASPPPPDYFLKVQRLCEEYKILTIADEVMCGAGRTGTFFAFENFSFNPDIVVLGKGINAGLLPLSAVLVKKDHVDEMKKGSGGFMHAQTYMQAPSSAAAGLAVLKYFKKNKVLKNVQKLGAIFHKELKEKVGTHAFVGNISGMGLFAGVEIVKNKTSKSPFDRNLKIAEHFVEHAFSEGLVVWPNTGQADGVNGDLFMLGPPLNSKKVEVLELVDKVQHCLQTFDRFT